MENTDGKIHQRMDRDVASADTMTALVIALTIIAALGMLGVSALVGVFTGH